MRLAGFVAFALLLPSTVLAAPCREPDLEKLKADHPECLFYAGTRHFREKNYEGARQSWQALAKRANVQLDQQHLQADAANNLGFLYYEGMGVTENHRQAIEYWLPPFKTGHAESAYHLCHAYGDAARPEYAPNLARGYCREALRRYQLLKEQGDGHAEVVRQIEAFLKAVGG